MDRTLSEPEPECRYGYSWPQIKSILGDRIDEFERWMGGQTMALCLPDTENDGAANHGPVVYPHDLRRFLSGGPILD